MKKIDKNAIAFKVVKNEKLKFEAEISIKKSAIDAVVDTQISEKAKVVKMPGFRPGKVPLHIVKQQFLPSILQNSLNDAVNQAIRIVMDEEKIKPASHPEVEIDAYDEEKDLSLKFTCETMPEIQFPDFSKIKIEKHEIEISDQEIDEELKKIAKHNRIFKDADAGAISQKDDIVDIDFVGRIDGEEFEGGKAENYDLLLGSSSFIPGFEDQLEGKKIGDKVLVKVSFPEDYGHKDFAGKNAEFDVTINNIQKGELPEIETELPQKLNFKSVEDLKNSVKDTMEKFFAQHINNEVKKDLFDVLEEKCEFMIPESLVNEEYDRLVEQIDLFKAEDPTVQGKSDEEIKEEFKKMSNRRVKIGLLVAEIAITEKIRASNEELSLEMQKQASMFPGQERQMIDYMLKNPKLIDSLKGPIVENKVVDFILAKANVSSKKISATDFQKKLKKA